MKSINWQEINNLPIAGQIERVYEYFHACSTEEFRKLVETPEYVQWAMSNYGAIIASKGKATK